MWQVALNRHRSSLHRGAPPASAEGRERPGQARTCDLTRQQVCAIKRLSLPAFTACPVAKGICTATEKSNSLQNKDARESCTQHLELPGNCWSGAADQRPGSPRSRAPGHGKPTGISTGQSWLHFLYLKPSLPSGTA